MNTRTRPFVILLVEDEKADAQLVKFALEENRLKVDFHRAIDGYEALQFLRRSDTRFLDAPRPDLILLDLNMPRLDGGVCLSAIKGEPNLRDIPVLVLSNSHAKRDADISRILGAADYIVKPTDMNQFVDVVRAIGERWESPRLADDEQVDNK